MVKYTTKPNTTKVVNIIVKGYRKIYCMKVSLKNKCVMFFLMGCPVTGIVESGIWHRHAVIGKLD